MSLPTTRLREGYRGLARTDHLWFPRGRLGRLAETVGRVQQALADRSFAIFAVLSLAGLAWSLKHLPVGPAYAVWTGIGAAVTVIIGIIFLNEAVSVLKVVSVGLIIAGVAGLNIATGGH